MAFYLIYAVSDLFYSETQVRLGSIPYLVSTPTTEDGQLDVATLRDRLAGYGDLAVGAMDLFFALNRLEPTRPADAAGFADLTCPLWRPDEPVLEEDAQTAPLAGEVVAQWIAGGGLPERPVRHAGAGVVCDAVVYPVSLDTFGLPPLLAAARSSEARRSPPAERAPRGRLVDDAGVDGPVSGLAGPSVRRAWGDPAAVATPAG